MKYVWIKKHRSEYELKWMCRMLHVSPSSYLAWLKKAKELKEQDLLELIRAEVQKSQYSYGYRRVCMALRQRGLYYGYHRIRRLMAEHQFHNVYHSTRWKKPQTTDSKHTRHGAPNHLGQCFDMQRPNQAWVTDITYVPVEGKRWAYVASIKDLYTAKIVGWSVQTEVLQRRGPNYAHVICVL
jgi:putative transposase